MVIRSTCAARIWHRQTAKAQTLTCSLYKWACQAKCLPRVNAIGKARGWYKLVTHWTEDQVREAYHALTEPAPNGRPH
jgi:hypothetical protein